MILLPLLFLLSPGFGPASAQQTRPNNMVTVSEGEDAVLKCDLSSENSVRRSTFDWRKDHGEQEVFMYENGKYSGSDLKGQSEQFVGRVVFFKDKVASGNASIKIKNTRLEDNGTYICNVMNPVTSVVHIILNVVGVLKTRENVPGAARVPYIETVHDKITWHELECKAEGVPEPEVEWRNSSGTVLAKHVPQNQNGRSRVGLKLNVTRSDNYTCVVTQRSIYHQINNTREVGIPEKEVDQESNMGLIIAVAVLTVLLLIVSGVLAVFCAQGRPILRPKTGVSSRKERKHLNGTNLSSGFDRQQMDGESE